MVMRGGERGLSRTPGYLRRRERMMRGGEREGDEGRGEGG